MAYPSDVQTLLDAVNTAGRDLLRSTAEDAGTDPIAEGPASRALITAAHNLIAGLQNPGVYMEELTWQTYRNSVVRALSDIGVFELVPPQPGTATLQELASKTGADEQLLYRLMRALTATGIFVEVEPEVYRHNALSAVCASGFKHEMKQTWENLFPASYKLPEYLQRTAYGTRPDPDGFANAFQYSINTKQSFFEFLKAHPERLATFNLAMEAIPFNAAHAVEAYPYDVELTQNPPSKEDEVLLVDVGGGHGHFVEGVGRRYPGLKGTLVLQDLKEVVDEIKDPKGFKPMAYDFFTPQPVKGARAYHFSRVFHDWSDDVCRKILSNTVAAMQPGHSRILISESVLPDMGAPPMPVLMDICMMLIGGMERSKKQWANMLEPLGLEIVKTWKKGGEEVIEAWLRE